MSKDVRNNGIILLLLIVLMWWLMKRERKVVTQTATSLRFDSSETPRYYRSSGLLDEYGLPMERVCTYNMGGTFIWPSLTDDCPPMFQGQTLVTDEVRRKLG
jgi:hypothetical protein